MAQRVGELDLLRQHALELVQRDSEAYDEVTAAYALPKATESDRAARGAEIQAALKGALEAPFATMQIALAALRLAAAGAPDINRNLASDCGVGGACLAEAIEGAFRNVRINAGSIKDDEYVRSRLAQCETMRNEARELVASLKRATEHEVT
jgi:formiminotetrahydrofolate cyclodeaminase